MESLFFYKFGAIKELAVVEGRATNQIFTWRLVSSASSEVWGMEKQFVRWRRFGTSVVADRSSNTSKWRSIHHNGYDLSISQILHQDRTSAHQISFQAQPCKHKHPNSKTLICCCVCWNLLCVCIRRPNYWYLGIFQQKPAAVCQWFCTASNNPNRWLSLENSNSTGYSWRWPTIIYCWHIALAWYFRTFQPGFFSSVSQEWWWWSMEMQCH